MTYTPYAEPETDDNEETRFGTDDSVVPDAAVETAIVVLDDDDTGTGAAASKGAKAARPSKAFYRRIAAKTVEVHEAEASVRDLAAAVLGGSADTADLTAAIMTAPRGAGAPLESIQEINKVVADDPLEAAMLAVELGKALKPVWSLLYALEAIGSPAPPAADAKAARALVKAISTLTDDQVLDLIAAADLIKRS